MKDIKPLLEKLSNAHGISGWEGSIQQIVREEIAPYVDEIKVDCLGNLIAIRKGEQPSIMIEAHADEIGLMVKQVDEKGFLRFIRIGGWFDQTLLNQRVIIHTRSGPVTGVIGCKPPHVMKVEDRKKVVEAKDMFIDIGCSDQKE
ncbi:MAG: cellulase, partial [Methanosaeta sp. ASP1-2]